MYSGVRHGKCPRRLVSSSKKCLQPCQQPYLFTIDLIFGFPYYFSSDNPIGGIACRILVVRAPVEGSAYYFLVLPYCNQEKKLGAIRLADN